MYQPWEHPRKLVFLEPKPETYRGKPFQGCRFFSQDGIHGKTSDQETRGWISNRPRNPNIHVGFFQGICFLPVLGSPGRPAGPWPTRGAPGALSGLLWALSEGSWRLLRRSWRLLGRSWRLPKGSNLVLGRTKNIPGAPTSDKKLDQPGFEPETFGSTLLLRRCLSH